MKDNVMNWHPEPVAGGSYSIWSATEEEQIWAVRETPVHHYKDDILFNYHPKNGEDFSAPGCTVEAKSRSQSFSIYDYSTNYCNMWNLFDAVATKFGPGELDDEVIEVNECRWAPKDPKKTCAKY